MRPDGETTGDPIEGGDGAAVALGAPRVPFDEAAAALGVPLDGEQAARFARLRDLLLERTARVNLTAVTDPAAVEERLFLDALRMLPALDAFLAGQADGGRSAYLLDVGSGAGFPGLPLKLARPDLRVTLLEATGKKVAFLRDAIAELDLDGVEAVHGRAEELGQVRGHRGAYDVVTARAVAALPVLFELCAPFLRVGGRGLFPKGTDLGEELAAGRRAAPLVGMQIAGADLLPGSGTRLVVADKVGPTAARYPRRAGVPAREPLGADGRRGT